MGITKRHVQLILIQRTDSMAALIKPLNKYITSIVKTVTVLLCQFCIPIMICPKQLFPLSNCTTTEWLLYLLCRVIQFYLCLFFSLPFVSPLCLLPLSFCFFLLKWFLHNSCHSSVVRASKTNSVWSFQCASRVSRLHFMHALEPYCPLRTIIFLEWLFCFG